MPIRPKTHLQRLKEAGLRPGRDDKAYDAKRMADPKLAMAKRIRNSGRWQRFRGWFKRKHPLCCDPLGIHEGQARPTEEVHHIEPVKDRPELACVENNCAPVCSECHHKIEAMEKKGQDTKHLFRKEADGNRM